MLAAVRHFVLFLVLAVVAAVGLFETSVATAGYSYDPPTSAAASQPVASAGGTAPTTGQRNDLRVGRAVGGSSWSTSRIGRLLAAKGLSRELRDLAKANITDSGETVLGHFRHGYIDKAKARGASYFDIGDTWNTVSKGQQTAANVSATV